MRRVEIHRREAVFAHVLQNRAFFRRDARDGATDRITDFWHDDLIQFQGLGFGGKDPAAPFDAAFSLIEGGGLLDLGTFQIQIDNFKNLDAFAFAEMVESGIDWA